MSFVSRTAEGSKVEVEKRRRLGPRELRRLRSAQMLAQRLKGWATEEIAGYFGVTPQWVNREIKAIPEKARAAIEGAYRRGELPVA